MIEPKIKINDRTFWFIQSDKTSFELNDIVSIDDESLNGIIQYLDGDLAGIRLIADSAGKGYTNGTRNGVQHFCCPAQDGMYVPLRRLTKRYLHERDQQRLQGVLESQGIQYVEENREGGKQEEQLSSLEGDERDAPLNDSPSDEVIHELSRSISGDVSEELRIEEDLAKEDTIVQESAKTKEKALIVTEGDLKDGEQSLEEEDSMGTEVEEYEYFEKLLADNEGQPPKEESPIGTDPLEEAEGYEYSIKEAFDMLQQNYDDVVTEPYNDTQGEALSVIESDMKDGEKSSEEEDSIGTESKDEGKERKFSVEDEEQSSKIENPQYKEGLNWADYETEEEVSIVTEKDSKGEQQPTEEKDATKPESRQEEADLIHETFDNLKENYDDNVEAPTEEDPNETEAREEAEGHEYSIEEAFAMLQENDGADDAAARKDDETEEESQIVTVLDVTTDNCKSLDAEPLKKVPPMDQPPTTESSEKEDHTFPGEPQDELKSASKENSEPDQQASRQLDATTEKETTPFQKIEVLRNQVEDQKDAIQKMEERLTNAQETATKHEKAYEQASMELMEFKIKKEAMDKKTDELQNDLKQHIEVMKKMENELEDAHTKGVEYKLSNEKAESELAEIEVELKNEHKKVEELHTQLEQQRKDIKELEGRLADAENETQKYRAHHQQAEIELMALKSDQEEKCQLTIELRKSLEQKKEEMEELEEKLSLEQKKSHTYMDSNKEAENKLVVLRASQELAVEEIEELSSKLEKQENKTADLEEKLLEAKTESLHNAKANEDNQERLSGLQEEREDQQEEIKELHLKMEELEKTASELKTELLTVRDEAEEYKQQNKQWEEKMLTLVEPTVLEELRNEVTALEKSLADKNAKLLEMHKEASENKQTSEQAKRNLADFKVEQVEVDKMTDLLRDQLDKQEQGLAIVGCKLAEAQKEVASCKASKEEAEEKIMELQEGNVEKEEQMEQLRTELKEQQAIANTFEAKFALSKEAILRYKTLADEREAELKGKKSAEEEFEKAKKEIIRLEEQKQALEGCLNVLESSLQESNEQRIQEAEKLQKSIEESQTIQKHLEESSARLEDSLKTSETESSELVKQLHEQAATITELEDKFVTTNKQGEKNQLERDQAIQDLSVFKKVQERMRERLRGDLSDARRARSDVECKLMEYKKSCEKAETRVQALLAEQKEKEEQNTKLKIEQDEKDQKNKELRLELDNTYKSLRAAEAEMEAVREEGTKYKQQRRETAHLKKKVDDSQIIQNKLEARAEALEESLRKLEEKDNKEIKKLTEKLATARAISLEYEGRNLASKDWQNENSILQDRLASMEAERSELTRLVKQQERDHVSTMEEMEYSLKRTQESYQTALGDAEQLQQQLMNTQAELNRYVFSEKEKQTRLLKLSEMQRVGEAL